MTKLSDIIKHLQTVIKETDLSVNDTIIFEQAIKIMISQKINESKKDNIKYINDQKEMKQMFPSEQALKMMKDANNNWYPINNGKNTPTEKQLNFLTRNKFKIVPGLTREEAKVLIKEFIERNKR